jgi:biotin operon repressor
MMRSSRRRVIVQEWYKLSGHELRIAELFHYYKRTFGRVFLSQETIARKLHISVRTVRRCIKRLQELGLLAVERRMYRNTLGQCKSLTNVYRLLSFIGAKVRSLLHRLAGRPAVAREEQNKEKEEPLDLSFVHNQRLKAELERFGRKQF